MLWTQITHHYWFGVTIVAGRQTLQCNYVRNCVLYTNRTWMSKRNANATKCTKYTKCHYRHFTCFLHVFYAHCLRVFTLFLHFLGCLAPKSAFFSSYVHFSLLFDFLMLQLKANSKNYFYYYAALQSLYDTNESNEIENQCIYRFFIDFSLFMF